MLESHGSPSQMRSPLTRTLPFLDSDMVMLPGSHALETGAGALLGWDGMLTSWPYPLCSSEHQLKNWLRLEREWIQAITLRILGLVVWEILPDRQKEKKTKRATVKGSWDREELPAGKHLAISCTLFFFFLDMWQELILEKRFFKENDSCRLLKTPKCLTITPMKSSLLFPY